MQQNKNQLQQKTLEILHSQHKRKFKTRELARMLKISPRDYNHFRNQLRDWAAAGVIAKHKSNTFHATKASSILTGKLHVKTHGYGFLLTPDGEEDVFISQRNMGTALDGDEVKIQLFARSEKNRPEGKVIEVLERRRRYIVGTLKKGKHYHFLVPDDLKITRDIYVHESDLNGAQAGQKVAVEIDEWEDELLHPEGHVAKVLGFPNEPGVDVLSVAASFNLPLGFPEAVEAEAKSFKNRIYKKDLKNRLDLREWVCFTIDPPDAKDYDDAVSIRKLDNGHFELGVHIADVSHYVLEDSELDKEAYERGTSVYLVDRVVPMLPEKLSNELCSLRPETDRLTFSCIIELSPAGEVVSYKIAETVIHSNRRFSYEEVQAFFDGDLELPDDLAAPLKELYAMHKILRRKRILAGSLEFETPEPKIILDEQGFPTAIERRESLESMQMIEEFMLLANKTVAQHIETLKTEEEPPPFVYRIHEKPNPEKITAFSEFASAMGYGFRLDGRISSQKLGTFLKKIDDENDKAIIARVMLRSMMKARYDIENAGHFGLAFKHYTHFTSPIRRYPDLVVHRLLKSFQQNGWHEELRTGLTGKLEAICQHTSARESTAQEAERASIKMKQVEFMASRLGEEFDGRVSGVVHFGIFVEITEFLVEGLVHISDLQDDYYTFDEKALTLEGISSGEKFHLGDPVRVKIVRVDTDERIIDLILLEKYAKSPASSKKRKHPQSLDFEDDSESNQNIGRGRHERSKHLSQKNRRENPDKKGDESKERTVTKRQLTRADDDRTIFTTMRQNKGRNQRSRSGSSQTGRGGGRRNTGGGRSNRWSR
jgi:ribonuclease R